jgi:hypothetical protein
LDLFGQAYADLWQEWICGQTTWACGIPMMTGCVVETLTPKVT